MERKEHKIAWMRLLLTVGSYPMLISIQIDNVQDKLLWVVFTKRGTK